MLKITRSTLYGRKKRDFDAWAQSDAFRKAHVKAGGARRGIYKGPVRCKPFVK